MQLLTFAVPSEVRVKRLWQSYMYRSELPLKYQRIIGHSDYWVCQTLVCDDSMGSLCMKGRGIPLCRLINWIFQPCLFCRLEHIPIMQERITIQKTIDFKIFFWGGGKGERKKSLPCTKAWKFLDFLSCLCFLYCLHLMPSKLSVEASFIFVLSQ